MGMNNEQPSHQRLEELKASLDEFRMKTRAEAGELRNLFDLAVLKQEVFDNEAVFNTLVENEQTIFAEEIAFALGPSRAAKGGTRRVAHLGSGWGVMSRELIRRNPALTVSDIDFNPVVCRYDQTYNQQHATEAEPFNRIQNYVMDAAALGIADSSMDEVISFGALRYITAIERGTVVSEALRVAKPGAQVILGEVNTPAVASFEQILRDRGISATKQEKEIEVLRATAFYFYYFLYHDLPFNSPAVQESFPIIDFKEQVDSLAKEEGKTPLEILLNLAGKDKRVAEVLVFERV